MYAKGNFTKYDDNNNWITLFRESNFRKNDIDDNKNNLYADKRIMIRESRFIIRLIKIVSMSRDISDIRLLIPGLLITSL